MSYPEKVPKAMRRRGEQNPDAYIKLRTTYNKVSCSIQVKLTKSPQLARSRSARVGR